MFFVTEVTDESLTTTAFNIEDGITIYLNPASDRLFVYLFIYLFIYLLNQIGLLKM